jgi:site-specific DNA-methyltransferase (adenine-specific)
MSRLAPGSVDLAFADPPFNIGYEYDVYDDRSKPEKYLDWVRRWGHQIHRVLKPAGTFWLAIGDEYAAELKLIFQNDLGFTCRSWVVWYYTFGVNCTKKFSRSHAHLFHFVRDSKNFKFNGADPAVRVPSARQLVYADSRADSKGRLPDDTWILRPQDLPTGFQPHEDTWYFSRVCGTFKERSGWHGCQMPEQLLGRIIRTCSDPGDLVLDPFGGSGTTLAVAKKLNRRWVGFELSSNYAERIKARLDAVQVGQALEGAEEPTVSAPPTPRRAVAASTAMASTTPLLRNRDGDGFKRGIIEAFFASRDGFSADRVITDPELNAQFLEACRRLGLPGQASVWNHQLMNLRKAKEFAGLPPSRRTRMTAKEADQCIFACEIAMQRLHEQRRSLDHVLCVPEEAEEFEREVRSMVAAEISSFKIRWVALQIRKRASGISQAGSRLESLLKLPRERHQITESDWDAFSNAPGLYWLASPNRKLYVGATFDLQQRFRLQFGTATQFDFWGANRRELNLRIRKLAKGDTALLPSNQSRWIAEWKPIGNFVDLAAA